jgi:hypothetical protein
MQYDFPLDVIQLPKQKPAHLALQLPEIVNHILSYLVIPYQFDESNKIKIYRNIYSCLLVNALWHDCATRLIWRHVTFEDTESEFLAFQQFAATVSGHHQIYESSSSSLAAGLAIAAPKSNNKALLSPLAGLFHTNDKRLYYLKQQLDTTRYQLNFTDFNDDGSDYHHQPLMQSNSYRSTRSNSQQQQQQLYTHHGQYRNAIRSIALRKIKNKAINEPLQQMSSYFNKLEKLDIYICDHLADSSIQTLICHNSSTLTYLSLAGCNRITDDAVLSIAEYCPKLEHLDLRACGLISDVSIQAIAENCPRLHHLNVGRVRDREKITMQSINLIAQKTQVAVLGLAGCDVTDECLILLAKCRGSGLERISLNNCYRITNKTVQAYVKYCPNLSVFEMKECHWITDWGSVAELVSRKVLLTLCDQQNRACAEWARQRGQVMEVKAPVK